MGLLCAQGETQMAWSAKRKLTWDDFKGKPVTKQSVAALTASGISYQFSTDYKNGKMIVNYEVHAFFYPEKSWYWPELGTELILGHEQLHFDISEIFAQRMRKRLSETTFTKNVKAEVSKIYTQVLKEMNQFQNRYDKETDFSRNTEQQLLWNKKVKEILGSG